MARKKSIKFLMKEALGKMASYGTSKHEMRELSKTKGVDLTKDKIFSYRSLICRYLRRANVSIILGRISP